MDAIREAKDAPRLGGRLPVLGHFVSMSRNSLSMFERAHSQLGPVFWCDFGFGHDTLIVLGEAGMEVFRSKATNSSHLAQLETFLGKSMLVVDGPDHKRMRGASGHAFTPAGLRRAKVGDIIGETVARRLGAWQGRERVPVVVDTRTVALEVIFRVMGVEVDDLQAWSKWYGEYTLGALNLPLEFPGTPLWRAKRARRWLDERIRKMIATARSKDDHDSLVGAMVHGRDDQGAGMSEAELIDNLLILGFAGHETTASTMAWSMIHLAHHPEYWDQLREQATALDGVPRDFKVLAERVPIAVGIFRESLRLYPPVAQDTRLVHAPFEIAGYRVSPGSTVGTSLMLLSRSPDLYEQPERWLPERWVDRERKPTPVENCQFGGGAHFCLGYHMALLEGTMFLVQAARTLAAWGVRPAPAGAMPKPRFLPLVQPPRKAELRLEKAR